MELILNIIMNLVKKIRNEDYHYLSVPDEVLSWVKVDRIMKLGHALPSVIVAILLAIKLLPLLSNTYAEQLEKNGTVISYTVIGVLIPLLILNGIIIESLLEKMNSEYKNFKSKETNANYD